MSPHGLLLWQTPILKYQIYIPSNNQLYQSTINRSLSTKRKSFTPQAGPKDDQDWDRAFADELKKRRGVRPSSPKPEQNGNSSNAPPPRSEMSSYHILSIVPRKMINQSTHLTFLTSSPNPHTPTTTTHFTDSHRHDKPGTQDQLRMI
jgi:hypothetical protein